MRFQNAIIKLIVCAAGGVGHGGDQPVMEELEELQHANAN
jgi:hypothetical protein